MFWIHGLWSRLKWESAQEDGEENKKEKKTSNRQKQRELKEKRGRYVVEDKQIDS